MQILKSFKAEIFKHYVILSLPQFHHAEFLLIVCKLYQKMESFTNSIITCRSPLDNTAVGVTLGQVSLDQLQQDTKHVLDGTKNNDPVGNKLFALLICRSLH